MNALDIDWGAGDDTGDGSTELGGQLPPRMVDHALAYAARGVPVFPCNPQPGKAEKAPLTGKGSFKLATTDPAQIRRWWARHPTALIGVPTGAKSGWLVIDPDAVEPGKPDGIANWAALQAEHGAVPATRTHRTQGGGLHVVFSHPGGSGITISEGMLAGKGIHVRGDGGYAIVPPSRMADGRSYSLADPTLEWTLAEAPTWLLDMIAGGPKAGPHHADALPAYLTAEAPDGIVVPQVDLPKPGPNALARTCPTFQRMVKDARTAGEKVWWKTCELAMHTTGGAELAHKLASQHPDYRPEVTQAKIDRHVNGGFGPPTCATLQALYGDASPCRTCPHVGNPGTSPVAIARRQAQQTAVGAMADDDPDTRAKAVPALDRFYALMTTHTYIDTRTGELWPAASVDGRLPHVPVSAANGGKLKTIKPSAWLDVNRAVDQLTWAPGRPALIRDHASVQGVLTPAPGGRIYNLYRAPTPFTGGDPTDIGPWLDHLGLMFPDERDTKHLIRWFAHHVQHPGVKCNHSIVFAGAPGIGKDSVIQPLFEAVGPGNFNDIRPMDLFGNFTGFMECIVLRINEVHDLGEASRYQFYEKSKTVIAAPPDLCKINKKYMPEYYCPNVCGIIMTTNDMLTMHLTPDDRRHYIAHSPLEQGSVTPDMFKKLYSWYERGGYANIAVYLGTLDIEDFDPKASPRRTDAFHAIIAAGRAPETDELASCIQHMGSPAALTLEQIRTASAPSGHHELGTWLDDRKNRKGASHRLRDLGYEAVVSDTAKDGLWKVETQRVKVYARRDLTQAQRHQAATALAAASAQPVDSPARPPLALVR